jgi:hypothetical protein
MNKYDLIANPPKFGVTSLLIEQLFPFKFSSCQGQRTSKARPSVSGQILIPARALPTVSSFCQACDMNRR